MVIYKPHISLTLLILVLPGAIASAQTRSARYDDRVVITRRKLTLIRTGEMVRQYPWRRKAVVVYPVISGLRNQEILRRVRAMLQFKNIFDSTLQEYRDDGWLEVFEYKVNYNQNYILDLTFMEEGSAAYPDSHQKHFTIDLRSGSIVKASDVFLAGKLDQLAALVNEKLQQELKDSTAEITKTDKDVSAEDLHDLYERLKFEVKNLDDFEVNKDGLVFLYDAGFPHVIQAWAPVGRYRFSYAELKPYLKADGLLWQFVP